jgi:hypothetical protein
MSSSPFNSSSLTLSAARLYPTARLFRLDFLATGRLSGSGGIGNRRRFFWRSPLLVWTSVGGWLGGFSGSGACGMHVGGKLCPGRDYRMPRSATTTLRASGATYSGTADNWQCRPSVSIGCFLSLILV